MTRTWLKALIYAGATVSPLAADAPFRVQQMDTPAAAGSSVPRVMAGRNGTLLLSWVEPSAHGRRFASAPGTRAIGRRREPSRMAPMSSPLLRANPEFWSCQMEFWLRNGSRELRRRRRRGSSLARSARRREYVFDADHHRQERRARARAHDRFGCVQLLSDFWRDNDCGTADNVPGADEGECARHASDKPGRRGLAEAACGTCRRMEAERLPY